MDHQHQPTIDLWERGTGEHHTYRIPALALSMSGTILAFCEGRRDGGGDAGQIDMLLRRSLDGGRSWEPTQIVTAEPGFTNGNPAPVVDRRTGTVVLLFCRNPSDKDETEICAGRAARTVWVTRSTDEGVSWSDPEEITASTKAADWTWYATGPGHGVQLESGRLVIPCDHAVGVHMDRWQDPFRSHVILSDDGGLTWEVGGVLPEGTNESTIAQLHDGRLHFNVRNHARTGRRGYAFSYDDGATFDALRWHRDLIEPTCQGSVVATPPGALLLSHPTSDKRENLTIRCSQDGGDTWSRGVVVTAGPAAYSDLVITGDGVVLCLYETGGKKLYESLRLASFAMHKLVGERSTDEVHSA